VASMLLLMQLPALWAVLVAWMIVVLLNACSSVHLELAQKCPMLSILMTCLPARRVHERALLSRRYVHPRPFLPLVASKLCNALVTCWLSGLLMWSTRIPVRLHVFLVG
jgi:hypothetical protein